MNGTHAILAPRPDIVAASPPGAFRNLRVANNVSTPNTKIGITADAVLLTSPRSETYLARSVSLTLDSAVSGPGGVETGTTVVSDNWYARHIIANPSTGQVSGLLAASATAPNLPAGFTYSAFTGWHRTSSGNFHRILQIGRTAQYVVSGSVTTTCPIMASGVSGSSTIPTWTAIGVSGVVPTTAASIRLFLWHSGDSTGAIAAPNNSYGGNASTTNPPPLRLQVTGGPTLSATVCGNFLLESSNVYYASGASNSGMSCMGWEDTI